MASGGRGGSGQVYSVGLVRGLVEPGAGTLADLAELGGSLTAAGHAIQARIYAEDPNKDFQPGAGLLTNVAWPNDDGLRIDTWIQPGTEVPPPYDPMLAQVIAQDADRV